MLALTGAEALYADMGHFGAGPIRWSWFVCVMPALVLNYLGQGALLLTQPEALENPFFHLFPRWSLVPMVLLATVATVIASQAVISGAFSMTKQAIQLGFLPRMRIVHTSVQEVGQIYVPALNTALLAAVIGAVRRLPLLHGARRGLRHRGHRHDDDHDPPDLLRAALRLEASACCRRCWPPASSSSSTPTFFAANVLKITEGGWFPLLIGVLIFVGMTTWGKGRQLLSTSLRADAVELEPFLKSVLLEPPMRAPGTAVFMNAEADLTPTALLHNLKHNNVLHESNLFVTVVNHEVPFVPAADRIQVRPLSAGCWGVTLNFGFKDEVDVPLALERLQAEGMVLEPMRTSYFLSRATVVPTLGGGMAAWREKLYANMHRNASSAADFLNLPPNRVIELGTKVQIEAWPRRRGTSRVGRIRQGTKR